VGKAPFFFCLWGVPFVLVGLYLIAGRFFVDARRRARTFYGLTGTRALIVVTGSTSTLTALDLAGQKHIELSEEARGRGSIRFGPPGGRRSPAPPTFDSIAEVSAVYAQVRDAQRALTRG